MKFRKAQFRFKPLMRAIDDSVDRLESVRRAPNKKTSPVHRSSLAPHLPLLRLAHAANLRGKKMISRAGKYGF